MRPLFKDVEGAGCGRRMWVLSKVAKFSFSAHREMKSSVRGPSPMLRVHELGDEPCMGGWGGTLPSWIPEATSVTPRVPVCSLFTRSMLPCSPDDNFNATQKGLRSYLNIHTKLPWAQLSR